MQAVGIIKDGNRATSSKLQGLADFRSALVTTLLQAAKRGGLATTGVFTVREIATLLQVSTATVYALIERGELPHVRVSSVIRVVLVDTDRKDRTLA